MEISAFTGQIIFVIVLYKKKAAESKAFRGIQLLMEKSIPVLTLVYDNSPYPNPVHGNGIIYRHDSDNKGVSHAYNEGFGFAKAHDKKWMLLLDQDTSFDDSFIRELFTAAQTHSQSLAFVPRLVDSSGMVSPFRWSGGRGKRMHTAAEKLPLKNFRFANSGLLINAHAFSSIGGYETSISLDFSDIAFGEKLTKVTDHFVTVNAALDHSFSGSSPSSGTVAIERFHYFCSGAFAMGRIFGNTNLYIWRAFLRALRLAYQYQRIDFIKVFLQRVRHS
jgi:GT2 family glycosyltransferase